jgi:hypothetical protein
MTPFQSTLKQISDQGPGSVRFEFTLIFEQSTLNATFNYHDQNMEIIWVRAGY